MKLLLLADLHFQLNWFRWASRAAVDAILIAGDLLNGDSQYGFLSQMIAMREWFSGLNVPTAFCSGNHDVNWKGSISWQELDWSDQTRMSLALAPRWMDLLESPGIIVDGRTATLEWGARRLVISTIPFAPAENGLRGLDDLWRRGAETRKKLRALWFVLNHEPPANTLIGGEYGDLSVFYKIQDFQPDYVLSGHIHSQPYFASFADQIGRTWCFNPRSPTQDQARLAKIPNHILLNTANQTATWFATPPDGREPIQKSRSLA